MSLSGLSDNSYSSASSSEEESDVPTITRGESNGKGKQVARQSVSKKDKKNVVIPALRPPRTAHYSSVSLHDMLHQGTIDLDPEYQRDVVWTVAKQSGLIDSLIHNYYIPPIIFAVIAQDDGSETRVCIDGKQRLTSLQQFMDGQIPQKDSLSGRKIWYKKLQKTERKLLLPENLKKIFNNKQIVSVEYEGLTSDQEREIFQRVQLGVALTPAERMGALTGPWPRLIREAQSQILGEQGFEHHLQWSSTRGRDFLCLTYIAYYMFRSASKPKGLASMGFPSTPQLENFLSLTTAVTPKFHDAFFRMLRIFVNLARDAVLAQPLHEPSKVSPVEFVMVGILIHVHAEELSAVQVSNAIKALRENVRKNIAEIRLNSKVMKHMVEFIATKVGKMYDGKKLGTDGKGDRPAAKAFAGALPLTTAATAATSGTSSSAVASGSRKVKQESTPVASSSKRKRRVISSDEEDDSDDSDDSESDSQYHPPRYSGTSTRPNAGKGTSTRPTTISRPAATVSKAKGKAKSSALTSKATTFRSMHQTALPSSPLKKPKVSIAIENPPTSSSNNPIAVDRDNYNNYVPTPPFAPPPPPSSNPFPYPADHSQPPYQHQHQQPAYQPHQTNVHTPSLESLMHLVASFKPQQKSSFSTAQPQPQLVQQHAAIPANEPTPPPMYTQQPLAIALPSGPTQPFSTSKLAQPFSIPVTLPPKPAHRADVPSHSRSMSVMFPGSPMVIPAGQGDGASSGGGNYDGGGGNTLTTATVSGSTSIAPIVKAERVESPRMNEYAPTRPHSQSRYHEFNTRESDEDYGLDEGGRGRDEVGRGRDEGGGGRGRDGRRGRSRSRSRSSSWSRSGNRRYDHGYDGRRERREDGFVPTGSRRR